MQIPKVKAIDLYNKGFTITLETSWDPEGITWEPSGEKASLQIILDKYYTAQEKEEMTFYVASSGSGNNKL